VRETDINRIKGSILGALSGKPAAKGTLGPALQHSLSEVGREKRNVRMSVGYSVLEKDYTLELRVHSKTKALEAANTIAKRFQDVNIQYVPRVEMPNEAATDLPKGIDWYRSARRPLVLGCSISHQDGGTGSLGGFVMTDRDRPCVLSCSHVLARCGDAIVGDWVHQPGRADKELAARTRVAQLSNFTVFTTEGVNTTDAAIAELNDAADIGEGNVFPDAPGVSARLRRYVGKKMRLFPEGEKLQKDETVYKLGRTTGFRTGRISAVSIDNLPVSVPSLKGDSYTVFLFDNALQIEWTDPKLQFSAPGDSGSLVFTQRDRQLYALGLVFAGGYAKSVSNGDVVGQSFACGMHDLLKRLDASWYHAGLLPRLITKGDGQWPTQLGRRPTRRRSLVTSQASEGSGSHGWTTARSAWS
jgi:hypothetical protein